MLEELNYTSVMKPVFSLDRLATTDLTHTIIGASNLTNSVLASDLCRQAPRRRDEIQVLLLVEVKRTHVLNCQLRRAAPSACSSPEPLPLGPWPWSRPWSRAVCYQTSKAWRSLLCPVASLWKGIGSAASWRPLHPSRMSRFGGFIRGEWAGGQAVTTGKGGDVPGLTC